MKSKKGVCFLDRLVLQSGGCACWRKMDAAGGGVVGEGIYKCVGLY